MKKRFIFIIVAFVLLSLACFPGAVKTYSKPKDYHIIYDNVENANKTFVKDGKKETLLGWGAYEYCSYMLLFPKEQPENLKEFEYYWMQLIDYDDYSIYFTYELTDEEFKEFEYELSQFTLSYCQQTNKLYYVEDCFDYPAYIATWSLLDEDKVGGLFEYILLDEANNTVINVYSFRSSIIELQEKADYNILPKNNDFSAVDELLKDEPTRFGGKCTHHTAYAFYDESGKVFVPTLEDIEYDRYFVDFS